MADSKQLRPVVVYPRDAVLDKEQLAAGLGIELRDVDRADLPTYYPTPRKPRYLWGQILDVIAERAA
jgi:hypothetical protein